MTERGIIIEETRLEGDTYQKALERYFAVHEIPPQIKVDPEIGTKRFFDEVEVNKAEILTEKVTHTIAVAKEGGEWVLLKDGKEVFSDRKSAGIVLQAVTEDYSKILIFNEDAYHCFSEAVMIEGDGYSSIARGKNMKFHRDFSQSNLDKTVFSFNPEETGGKPKERTAILVYDRESEDCDYKVIRVDKSFNPVILSVNSDYSKIIWEDFDKNVKFIFVNEKQIAGGETFDQRFSRDGEQYFVVSKDKHGVNLINFNGHVIREENVAVARVEASGDFSVGVVELVKKGKRRVLAMTSGLVDYSPEYDEVLDYHAHESDVVFDVVQNLVKKRFTFKSRY